MQSHSASDPDFLSIKILVLYLLLPFVTLWLILIVIFYRRARFLYKLELFFEDVVDRVFEFVIVAVFDTLHFLIKRDQRSRREQVLEHIACSAFDEQQRKGSWIVCMEEHYAEQQEETCSICLEEYVVGDIMRKLPKCGHFYHRNCVDSWFLTGPFDCPICRCPVGDSL